MTRGRYSTAAALLALPLCLATALSAAAADIVGIARDTSRSDQFQIDAFGEALETSGLADELKAGGPYTVFAPTNAAFATLDLGGGPAGPQATATTPGAQLEAADKEQLAEVLSRYIVEGELPFEELIKREKVETIGGTELEVTSAKGGILVNEIEIVESDIAADNGVIHVLGGLLEAGSGEGGTGPERQH